jgi:hypothetical protein
MAHDQTAWLRRENEHLTARCAALQGEVWDLSSRLANALRRLDGGAAPIGQRHSDMPETRP